MTELVLQPTETAHWHVLVNEAQCAAACQLEEPLESYLVFLLMRFTRRPDMLSRIMASDYLESQKNGKVREEQLRDVGDHCLLLSGLFPSQAQRRRVSPGYFVDLGRSAYYEIAERGLHMAHTLFADLAREFVMLMDTLQAIRSLSGTGEHQLAPLQAYEQWRATGSLQAFERLCSLSDTLTLVVDSDDPTSH